MLFETRGDRITIRSPAKLNLYLEIVGKRPDGYHNLVTIMQEIDLFDTLVIAPEGREGIQFTISDPSLPQGGDNLVVRAARRFLEKCGVQTGLKIHLEKSIPSAAGMGGASGNASAALFALNQLFETKLSLADLAAEAATIGSDCPFFLYGKTAVCNGRGEEVKPQNPLPPYTALVICPNILTSTASVYRKVVPPSLGQTPGVDSVLAELRSGDLRRVREALFNRLEEAALDLQPELAEFQKKVAELGLPEPRLTGSGSSFYSILESADEAVALQKRAEESLEGSHRGVFVTSFVT